VGLTTYEAKDPDIKFPPIEPLRPPEGAPNVVIALMDDVGVAASCAFGGIISTPTADRLAQGGPPASVLWPWVTSGTSTWNQRAGDPIALLSAAYSRQPRPRNIGGDKHQCQ
jgi:hypothetical protein